MHPLLKQKKSEHIVLYQDVYDYCELQFTKQEFIELFRDKLNILSSHISTKEDGIYKILTNVHKLDVYVETNFFGVKSKLSLEEMKKISTIVNLFSKIFNKQLNFLKKKHDNLDMRDIEKHLYFNVSLN